jgi:hypothetical protein
MRRTVLVLGDLLVDRSWLVGPEFAEKRAPAPGEPLPRSLIEPRRHTDVAGGIGTVARAIAAIDPDRPVIAAGIWDKNVDENIDELVPPKKSDFPKLKFLRLGRSKFTSIRHRIYVPEVKAARLLYRFDRDLDATDVKKLDLSKLPPERDVALLILADYDGKLLDRPDLKRYIGEHYANCPIIIRSSNADLVGAFDWSILTLNLYRFTRFLDREELFDLPMTKQVDNTCRWHPDLIEALSEFVKKVEMRPERVFLLNLEEDGALLLHDDEITPLVLTTPEPTRGLNMGANDVQLAWFVHSFLKEWHPGQPLTDKLLQRIGQVSVRASTAFSARAQRITEVSDDYYAAEIKVDRAALKLAPAVSSRSRMSLKGAFSHLDDARKLGGLLFDPKGKVKKETTIRLHDAKWYLNDFLTINSRFGTEIVKLKRRMADYLVKPASQPFVAAVCGEPGAGKSTLAEKLATALGCDAMFENAAQWNTTEDLGWMCERIRTAQMRRHKPLVFIDEVDTPLHGEHLYGKLLAPLWDGEYVVHGDKRALGPTIFLLAGSDEFWHSRDSLLGSIGRSNGAMPSKLEDLVSRITVHIDVPALPFRREDVVYLTASYLLQRFPRIESAEEGLFRLFAQSTPKHGSRSIGSVIKMLRSSDGVRIHTADIPTARDKELDNFLANVPPDWRAKQQPIKITA